MKRLILSIITLTLAALSMNAQSLSVTDISELSTNMKARVAQVRDNNGELCALVEVAIPSVEGLTFDANKVVKSSYEDGIYSLYVPAGTKSISYKHKDYLPGTIDLSGISIDGGSTYRVILKKNDGALEYQFLVINVTPKSAVVEVDGQPQLMSDGTAQMLLEVGSFHHYKVTASGMRPEEGEAYIASADDKTIVNVALVENITKVKIIAPAKADIYLNERKVGNSTWEGSIAPGAYRIAARIDGYTVAEEVRTIQASDDVQQLELSVQYGILTITTSVPNASVQMDGEAIGETPLRLSKAVPGKHVLKFSKDGFKDATANVVVRSGEETKADVKLEAIPQRVTKTEAQKPKKEPKPEVQKPVKEPKVATPKPAKAPKASAEPFIFAGANIGYAVGSGTPSFGVMGGYVKDFGAYAKFRSSFSSVSSAYECDSSGSGLLLDGEVKHSRSTFTVGGIMHIAGPLYPYAGIGFGSRNTYWQMSPTSASSDNWAKVSDYSCAGAAVEAGVMLKLGSIALSAGANCTAFKFTDIEVGVCLTF